MIFTAAWNAGCSRRRSTSDGSSLPPFLVLEKPNMFVVDLIALVRTERPILPFNGLVRQVMSSSNLPQSTKYTFPSVFLIRH